MAFVSRAPDVDGTRYEGRCDLEDAVRQVTSGILAVLQPTHDSHHCTGHQPTPHFARYIPATPAYSQVPEFPGDLVLHRLDGAQFRRVGHAALIDLDRECIAGVTWQKFRLPTTTHQQQKMRAMRLYRTRGSTHLDAKIDQRHLINVCKEFDTGRSEFSECQMRRQPSVACSPMHGLVIDAWLDHEC